MRIDARSNGLRDTPGAEASGRLACRVSPSPRRSASRAAPLPRLLALAVSVAVSVGCEDERAAGLTGNVVVDRAAAEIEIHAVFQRAPATEGSWHLLVQKDGSMAQQACFVTDASPQLFYDSLRGLAFEAANTITCDNMGDLNAATRGELLDYSFEWATSAGRRSLDDLFVEVVPESEEAARGKRGIEMRFGGNHTGEDEGSPPSHRSGCLACLYTCCAGVTSNSRANLATLRADGDVHRYRIRPGVKLDDGTVVTIFVRRKPTGEDAQRR